MAPYGCGPGKKIQKAEALDIYKQIGDMLDLAVRDVVSPTPPSLLNQCLAYRVDVGENIYNLANMIE